MMHTCFLSTEAEADSQYDLMKNSLSALLEAAEQTAKIDGGRQVLMDGVDEFVGSLSVTFGVDRLTRPGPIPRNNLQSTSR